jgi:hypothetical protein
LWWYSPFLADADAAAASRRWTNPTSDDDDDGRMFDDAVWTAALPIATEDCCGALLWRLMARSKHARMLAFTSTSEGSCPS